MEKLDVGFDLICRIHPIDALRPKYWLSKQIGKQNNYQTEAFWLKTVSVNPERVIKTKLVGKDLHVERFYLANWPLTEGRYAMAYKVKRGIIRPSFVPIDVFGQNCI